MSDVDFDHQYQQLLAALARTVALLRRHSVDFWADWLESDRARIAAGERPGLDHLLRAFGGMGSLNDLIMHPLNGHAIDEADVEPVNEALHGCLATIWATAKAMQRELDRS